MSGTASEFVLLDRHLLLPEELRNPNARFTKSLFLFVLLLSSFAETILSVTAFVEGHTGVGILFAILTLLPLAALPLLRSHFHPSAFTAGFVLLGAGSSAAGVWTGFDAAPLLWHLFLPSGALLALGGRWGAAVLGADLLWGVAQAIWLMPIWPLVGWLVTGTALFFLFLLFLNLVRHSLTSYEAGREQALDLLSQSKDNEARWAEQARFLETLMDVIPFPLFHKGVDGRYLSANASFRVVFDVAREAVTGQKNDAFLAPENAKTLAKIELDLLARDSMAVEETVLIHADGHPHDFIVYLMPFVDEHQAPLGSIGVLIDITDRKLREGKLEKLNATKDQLFSIISHDLRGPVGKLKQLLDIYVDDPSIFDKATWDQVFHDMRRSADSLFQLLENLLGWARSQQGNDQVRFESVALEPLVGDVFAVLKLLASEKRINLELDIKLEGPLLTDRHVLSTILRNLVHNALKFTSPGGKITVHAEETVDDLWIAVRDTGVGMTDEVLHRLFKKKERITTYGTGKEKGQGIGLGLCQDLAESIGAHLEVESTFGVGTTMRLHLPAPEL